MVHVRKFKTGQFATGQADEVGIFGNAGALYIGAMTWWDHKTLSIWSQPTGEAISGRLEGTQLALLPAQIIAWQTWRDSYPHTFVMTNDLEQRGTHQPFRKGFVIGVVLADQAKAFDFKALIELGVINDFVGHIPIVVWAQDQEYRSYVRTVDKQQLTFALQDEGYLLDQETGSRWDPRLGMAIDGPLAGKILQSAPSITSYDWAWRDFYPNDEIISR